MIIFEAIAQLCVLQLPETYECPKFTGRQIFDIIQDKGHTFNYTMMACRWRNDVGRCEKFFKTILTEEGVCFTFNSLNSHDIYTEEYKTY